MTRYMLDTTCFVLMARRNSIAKAAILRLAAGDNIVGTCAVTIAEYYAGRPLGEQPEVDALIHGLECWPIVRADGLQAGAYRRTARAAGFQMATPDMLIAAVAARLGATVVTENLKDFFVGGATPVSLLSL